MTPKGYLIGETVRLTLDLTDPVGGQHVDAAVVTLVSLVRAYPIDITALTVVRDALGRYHVDVNTTGYVAGKYTWTMKAADSMGRATIVQDYFVLAAV